jgi:glutamyl-tRNA synthetase
VTNPALRHGRGFWRAQNFNVLTFASPVIFTPFATIMLPSRCIVSKPSGWICRACLASVSLPLVPQRRTFASKKQSRKPDQLLPSSAARTRFAPSPTGYLHLGSLRTALFNYLLAKATGGQFLLRIEDTDTKRTVPGAAQRIFDDLRWAGLQWDEGPEVGGPYGPYYQSQRGEIYREHGAELLKTGHAYRCFCSAERLDELARARAALGLPTDYDRSCLSIPEEEAADRACKGESHTIRLKVPDIYRGYKDVVYGKVGTPKQKKMIHGEPSYEDPVLVKSDGQPTYHLANVVDDHLMEITHVIRGVEWMPSTFKHIAMYEAFGWTPPEFAHVGLLQDKDGQKLSKRKMDIDIDSYRNNGIFPEALVNHVALLGWSHQEKTDFLPIQRLIEIVGPHGVPTRMRVLTIHQFDMKFTKGNTIVNFPKMTHLQKWYAQRFIDTDEKDTDLFKRKLSGMVDSVLSVVKRQGESVEKYARLSSPRLGS